jgi:hypothetical protein
VWLSVAFGPQLEIQQGPAMADPKKTLVLVRRGGVNITFRELQHLMEALGFWLIRISGSHHIFVHPRVFR